MAINLANNNSLANITALPSSVSGGAMTLLATQTASGSANLSFTSGIDSTYDSYVFKLINIHSVDNSANLRFNLSVDGGSNYNVTKTSSAFAAWHKEDDSGTSLAYNTGNDLAQSTDPQRILFGGLDNANDGNGCATLQLFAPSSTTFVKNFLCTAVKNSYHPYAWNTFVAGYGNTTSAVNAVQFSLDSGNIQTGVIKLYGIS